MIYVTLGPLPRSGTLVSFIFDEERVEVWIGTTRFRPEESTALAAVCRAAGSNDAQLEYRGWVRPGFAVGARADTASVELYYETDGLTSSIAFVPREEITKAATFIETARDQALEIQQWRRDAIPVQQQFPVQPGWEKVIQ